MRRRDRSRLAALSGIALVAGLFTVSALTSAAPAVADMSPVGIAGRGAPVPFVEQEAEDAVTNGTVIGPNRTYNKLPSEASGRKAVTLSAVGQYVEFTLTKPANAMTLRYSVPDNSAGTGITAPIELRVNGTKLKDLSLTSRYGWFYGSYPFSNSPGAGNPHHFYDETRTMFGSTLAAGTKVSVQVASTAVSPTFTVDLADFELVAAPLVKPAGALDVVADYGADPTGKTDSTTKIQAAVNAGAAQKKPVWIPQGTFLVTDHIVVDGVTLAGAGPWYSVLTGNRVGVYGKYANAGGPSQNVTLKDFAILGEVMERNDNDQVNAVGGAMSNSLISDLWMQHVKVGAWMDGPMTGLTITDCRILDVTADGINFHTGVSDSTVTNTFVRNAGDDGIAQWADTVPEVNNTFSHNTVVVPVLANNIAIYGGQNIDVTDNVVSDTVNEGGGIHVANRFPGVSSGNGTAIAGTINIARNTLIRAGNWHAGWQVPIGALWFDGANEPITGATINVTDAQIVDSSYAAVQFVEGAVSGVHFSNVVIDRAGTFALQFQSTTSATFDNVKATGIGYPNPIYSCQGSGVTITQGAGNSGWYTGSPYCGSWPAPAYGAGTTTPATPTSPASPTTTPATVPTTAPAATNLAAGRPVTASSAVDVFVASKTIDGNASTYWESANNAFPQSLTVDLGASTLVNQAVLKLPPSTDWGSRTQTVAVSGSTDGSTYTPVLAGAAYTFNAAAGNAATIALPAGNLRYLRLTFTANSGWPAAQLSEIEVYGPTSTTTPSATATTPVPTTAAPTTAAPTTAAPTMAAPTTAAPTTTVAPTPSSTVPAVTNVAAGRPVTASSAVDVYVASKTVDGDTGTYWESASNAFPQSLTVDLGASTPVSQVVLKLPPATAWGSRTQTVSVSGSTDGTSFSPVVAAAAYTFNAAAGNTATIGLPAASLRYVRVTFTANSAWPAAQLSEFEVYGTASTTATASSTTPATPSTVPAGTNLAGGRPATTTSSVDIYVGSKTVDGNVGTYWESAANAFPQALTIDLGTTRSVGRIVVKLPPVAAWGTRSQTIAVTASGNGTTYSTVKPATSYVFDASAGNTATITFGATGARFLRLAFTANSGPQAAQVSEVEAYAA